MPSLSVTISGYVAGDDLEIRRTITTPPQAIETAWLTLKTHAGQSDANAARQKEITTSNVPGTGQIETAGGPSTDGVLRFDLTAANTRALGTKKYLFDVQVQLASTGKLYTAEKGTFTLTDDVTKASD